MQSRHENRWVTNPHYDCRYRVRGDRLDSKVEMTTHLSIDPVPGQPTLYVEIREFIETLPR
jgi:hypothetical protein